MPATDRTVGHAGPVRGFLAGLAAVLVFFTATAGLAGAVGLTLLDPHRAGDVVATALGESDLASRILGRVVPGYTTLDPSTRAAVRGVVRAQPTLDAARRVEFDASTGKVDLQPLRQEVVDALRQAGQPRLAATVAHDERGSVVTVPMKDLNRYRDARELSRRAALLGGLATLVLAGVALLSSRHRLRTGRSVGVAVALAALVVGAAYWLLPGAAQSVGSNDAAKVASALLDLARPRVLVILGSALGVGVLLILTPLIARPFQRARPAPGTSQGS